MNLFLRCFGCKKQSKKKKNDANSSNVKFNSFVNQEINLRNNISLDQEKKISKENEKNHDKSDNKNEEKKIEILIGETSEEKKYKKTNEELITEEPEKSENKVSNEENDGKKENKNCDENKENKENKNNNKDKEDIICSKFGLNLKKDIDFDEPLLKTDSPLISDFEKNIIFTKGNLTELFDKFWNLDKYKKIWDKDNLQIEIRSEGTDINDKFNLIKIIYRQIKSTLRENADIQTLIDFIYLPELRIKWDKILKNLEVLDGNLETNYVIRTIAKSPNFLMSERESIEKRIIFKNKEGNAIYVMSSSIPNELFPTEKDVVRIINYINYYKVVDEGDYICFYSLNQTDFKMSIPQFLINVTLPTTTKNWQIELEKFANEIKYDKDTKKIIPNNKAF